ncbi:MAG TPA: response regulator [Thermoanaerobaculia bacterium]|jgi:CheY-like chemotaxis protein|nr:response regulator [Thermoanaerobaculia bacterium]
MKPCFHCYAKFDDANLKWCDCVRPLRTLVCPSCHRCFCTAPLPYKRAFWDTATRSLKEAPERFSHDAVPAYPAAGTLAPVVLVVDDDEAIRSLVACRIRQLGYRVATTSEPQHALMMARSREVAIVLTDALMPQMDGRELCLRIKSTDEGASKKVVVMTSLYRARRYADEAVLRYSADAYITKPIDFLRLGDLLGSLAPIEQGTALAS